MQGFLTRLPPFVMLKHHHDACCVQTTHLRRPCLVIVCGYFNQGQPVLVHTTDLHRHAAGDMQQVCMGWLARQQLR